MMAETMREGMTIATIAEGTSSNAAQGLVERWRRTARTNRRPMKMQNAAPLPIAAKPTADSKRGSV